MDLLTACGLCAGFVGSFYVWPRERAFVKCALQDLPGASLDPKVYVDRNDPAVIHRRALSFVVVSCCSVAYLFFAAANDRPPSSMAPQVTAGEWTMEVYRVVATGVTTLCLFLGSIIDGDVLSRARVRHGRPFMLQFRDLVLCPLGEEVFFRGVLFDVFRHRSPTSQVVLSASLFAITHSHHIFAWAAGEYREEVECGAAPGKGLERACWRSAFRTLRTMYAITFAFGVVSGVYYVRVCRRSILAVTLAHGMCNALGAPAFSTLRSTEVSRAQRVRSGAAYLLGIGLWMTAVVSA